MLYDNQCFLWITTDSYQAGDIPPFITTQQAGALLHAETTFNSFACYSFHLLGSQVSSDTGVLLLQDLTGTIQSVDYCN